jgi:RNA polymerase sigma-70 factor (ECF subfamily)
MAEELDMTEGSVRVAVHRLRRQYRELLPDEIAQTVADEDQIDDEMGCLFAALAH